MVNWHHIRKQKLDQLRQSLQSKIRDVEGKRSQIDDEQRLKVKLSNIKWEVIKYKKKLKEMDI